MKAAGSGGSPAMTCSLTKLMSSSSNRLAISVSGATSTTAQRIERRTPRMELPIRSSAYASNCAPEDAPAIALRPDRRGSRAGAAAARALVTKREVLTDATTDIVLLVEGLASQALVVFRRRQVSLRPRRRDASIRALLLGCATGGRGMFLAMARPGQSVVRIARNLPRVRESRTRWLSAHPVGVYGWPCSP